MLSKKYAENHSDEGFSLKSVNELIYEISSMNLGISDDIIDMNLKEFIRKNALTTSLMDNIDTSDNITFNERSNKMLHDMLKDIGAQAANVIAYCKQ